MNTTQLNDVIEVVRKAIGTAPLRFNNERELQDELQKRFKAKNLAVHREFPLTESERLDFVLAYVFPFQLFEMHQIAIEIKVKQPSASIIRQVKRYCASPRIDGAILICPQPIFMPPDIWGKPVGCIPIWKLMI